MNNKVLTNELSLKILNHYAVVFLEIFSSQENLKEVIEELSYETLNELYALSEEIFMKIEDALALNQGYGEMDIIGLINECHDKIDNNWKLRKIFELTYNALHGTPYVSFNQKKIMINLAMDKVPIIKQ